MRFDVKPKRMCSLNPGEAAGWGGGGDGEGFPDDVVGGLMAHSATSVLDYHVRIMSAFAQRKKKTWPDF